MSPGGSSADQFARLLGSEDVFSLLDTGLPGIPVARYEELRQQAASEPLIDKLAPAIVFPTIIRNVSTGQGEPFGFIFAVDDQYDRQFGLHTVQGQPVTMASLRPGAGNIFQLASNLFATASKTAAGYGPWAAQAFRRRPGRGSRRERPRLAADHRHRHSAGQPARATARLAPTAGARL